MIVKSKYYNMYSNSTTSSNLELRKDLDFIPIALLKDVYSTELDFGFLRDEDDDENDSSYRRFAAGWEEIKEICLNYYDGEYYNDADIFLNNINTLKEYVIAPAEYNIPLYDRLKTAYQENDSENIIELLRKGIGFNNYIIGNHSLFSTNYNPYFIATINHVDLEQYKLCVLMGEEFPNDKVTILIDSVLCNKSTGNIKKFIDNKLNDFKNLGFNLINSTDLFNELFVTNTMPKFIDVIENKRFISEINSSFLASKKGIVQTISNEFKVIKSIKPSIKLREFYTVINNRRIIRTLDRTMNTITIKKSEMAKLIGLGQSTLGIANQLGIEEKDLKEKLIELGLIKSKKSLKSYIINLEEDI